ncbi:MAG TPA: Dyp-type peroxidase [Chloroflexota bacterium]|nr:Dyp-type peroxidase [Chloroflexota bacterium]
MQERVPELELDDMQGLIGRGYAELRAASYMLLRIDDPASARSWLGRVAEEVTPASARPEDAALNVAITASGVQQLGLSPRLFSNEFRTGMTTPRRRRALGDLGDSAPERWLWGGPDTPRIDLLLLVFGRDAATLDQRRASLAGSVGDSGVSEVLTLETAVDLDGKEHFGFADGISQPTIAGLSSRADIPPNTIRSGEFILGYPNEYGRYTARPLLEPSADPDRLLPQDVEGSGQADFGRNGTYLVFRQLSQDVRGFWRFVDQAARGTGRPEDRAWLAAKMVGRWPSGAPLTLAGDADDPMLATANDFTYQYADPLGLQCPVGAHVRRAHPRDSLDPDPGTVRSVALDKRHRLLRRGREYGPPVDDVLAPAPPDDPDRGLYFICLIGNIARQFEFVQHTWLNNPKFAGLYDEPDPLVANHALGAATFSVPADPVRLRYTGLPTFVSVRGGGYFFLPGLRALRYLAATAAGWRQPGNTSSPVGS